jgi:hypothetical protein
MTQLHQWAPKAAGAPNTQECIIPEPSNEESYLAMKTILSIYVKLWVAILIGDISAWEQEWSVVINNFYKAVFNVYWLLRAKKG